MTTKEVLSEAEEKMKKAVEHTKGELAKIRTGRASPELLFGVKVDYYGSPTPLNQLAVISNPEPRMLIIQPFDPSVRKQMVRAIEMADLGVTVRDEGQFVRVLFPELSGETRAQLAKVAAKRAEEGKVAIRNVRKDARGKLEELKKGGGVSEDEVRRVQKQLDELTEEHIEEVEVLRRAKEEEIMTF